LADFIGTQAYASWINALNDVQGRARILARVRKFEITGHAGDTKPVGGGVREMRLDFGPGYRVYFIALGKTVILLGGDKSTQAADIRKALEYADYWKGQNL
jgi:putative addiction module killer protein